MFRRVEGLDEPPRAPSLAWPVPGVGTGSLAPDDFLAAGVACRLASLLTGLRPGQQNRASVLSALETLGGNQGATLSAGFL